MLRLTPIAKKLEDIINSNSPLGNGMKKRIKAARLKTIKIRIFNFLKFLNDLLYKILHIINKRNRAVQQGILKERNNRLKTFSQIRKVWWKLEVLEEGIRGAPMLWTMFQKRQGHLPTNNTLSINFNLSKTARVYLHICCPRRRRLRRILRIYQIEFFEDHD